MFHWHLNIFLLFIYQIIQFNLNVIHNSSLRNLQFCSTKQSPITMNQYLTHVFEQFTLKSSSKEFNALIKQELIELKPVDLTKIYKQLATSTVLFNELNLLLAKGVIKYSPANCTVELSLPNVMVYQRMFKMAYFAQQELDAGVGQFVNEWVEQGLQNGMGFPVMFEKKRLEKVFALNPLQEGQNIIVATQESKKKGKSKGKQQQQQSKQVPKSQHSTQYNYHKLIYEYKSSQKAQIQPKSQQAQKNSAQNLKKLNKPSRKTSKQIVQDHTNSSFQSYMLNVQQLTRLMQWHMLLREVNGRLGQKQKKMTLFEFVNCKDREQISQQVKYQKLQQFIAQILSANCLLVFNLIKKYPYLTQKQLIKLTMLEVLQTRSSLNQLLQKGLVYFYSENARTIVYKVVDGQILEQKYLDTLAKGMVNLALVAERVGDVAGMAHEKVKNKLIELECQMQRIDDVMIMFGW